MLILIGKSGSGKDAVAKELQKRGWERIITDTTRKPRGCEKNGVDYNFISDTEFFYRFINDYYIETKKYVTADEKIVSYGTPNFSNKEKQFVILSPRSFTDINEKVSNTSVYLYANNSTIKNRLLKRGDDKDEIARRMTADSNDFKGIENEVDKIVYNDVGYDIKEIADKIEKIATEAK